MVVRGRDDVIDACARCGHGRDAHEHFRAGTDCAVCTCPRFLRRRLWRARGRTER